LTRRVVARPRTPTRDDGGAMLPPPRGLGARGLDRGAPGAFRGRATTRDDGARRRGTGRRTTTTTTTTTTTGARGRAVRSIKEPNGASGAQSASGGASTSASGGDGKGVGWGKWFDKASELTRRATATTATWAQSTQNVVTKEMNEKAKLIQPSMNVAVDHFGPTARQINNLLKPVTEPIRKEWMNLKPETRRVMKGGFFGAFFGNLVLGWPARADRKRLRAKVEQMHLERAKMLVDDFSLEREVLSLNAENRRLEKRTLRAEMALNAIKRRLGEYVVAPKDETHFADPNLSGVMPGAPWANDLLDAVGSRVESARPSYTSEPKPTAVNSISSGKDGWSRDEAWAQGFLSASAEASSDGVDGGRPTAL
jgi:hypothetical protein